MTTSDHEAITRTVYEYAYGIDTRDWPRYRDVFTDEIHMDFSSYNERPASTMSADAWMANAKVLFTGLDATQHTMSNPLVDVDGDSARCRMYMQAAHFLTDWPNPEFTIGGYYDDQLVRTDDGWRISAVTLTVWWRRGDAALMVEAAGRGKRILDAR
ncbi:MAG: nuclear transport factor 2 family protein [Actinomycetota bacterium]